MENYFKILCFQNILTQKLLQCVLVALGIKRDQLKEILDGVNEEAEENLKRIEKEFENGD